MEMPDIKKAMPVGFAWHLEVTNTWLILCDDCMSKAKMLGKPHADLYETKGDSFCDLCHENLD
jgi:hypothetical protein